MMRKRLSNLTFKAGTGLRPKVAFSSCSTSSLVVATVLLLAFLLLVARPILARISANNFYDAVLGGLKLAPTGTVGTLDYKVYLEKSESEASLSFWHDLPLSPKVLDSQATLPLVIEIPMGTKAKMEINKETASNPIIQDTKKGKLRFYPIPSITHYGGLPRTYEHPESSDLFTGLEGDGDPVDAVDLSELPSNTGDVEEVKVLGALGMIDDGAADWKIVTLRVSDPLAAAIDDISSIMDTVQLQRREDGSYPSYEEGEAGSSGKKGSKTPPAVLTRPADKPESSLTPAELSIKQRLHALKRFFEEYKKDKPNDPNEKSPITFAFQGHFLGAEAALQVIRSSHTHWCDLVKAAAAFKLEEHAAERRSSSSSSISSSRKLSEKKGKQKNVPGAVAAFIAAQKAKSPASAAVAAAMASKGRDTDSSSSTRQLSTGRNSQQAVLDRRLQHYLRVCSDLPEHWMALSASAGEGSGLRGGSHGAQLLPLPEEVWVAGVMKAED